MFADARRLLPFAAAAFLAACAGNDLQEPPVPLGDFALGLNIVVADNVQKVPISRDASVEEWEAAMKKAVNDRFGRYQGNRLYNFGISVDGYALAPPGIPIIAAPKSVLVITANIWDDASQTKLNAEGRQFHVFENLDGESFIGTGLTRTKAQQMEALSYNAVKKVEGWLLENPQWFAPTGPVPDPVDGAAPAATPAAVPAVPAAVPAAPAPAQAAVAPAAAAAPSPAPAPRMRAVPLPPPQPPVPIPGPSLP